MSMIIGVDESGKGDFFGPLVIAALAASDQDIETLRGLGVRDSKQIADKRLLQIDDSLRKQFPFAVRVILPVEYNPLYRRIKNLNVLLADGHALVIERVAALSPADKAISDQFGKPELIERALSGRGCSIHLEQTVRAESIPQVGAASIIARAEFIRQMEQLSEQAGMTLPKGAGSPVDLVGARLVQQLGSAALERFAKHHFKNYIRVTARAAATK